MSPDSEGGEITFEGGDGASIQQAVIIRGAGHDLVGTIAEFRWLAWEFGKEDVDWGLETHSHGTFENRQIDTVVIRLSSGAVKTVYFDITDSFGKWPPL